MISYVIDYFTKEVVRYRSGKTIRFVNSIVDGILFFEYTNDTSKVILIQSPDGFNYYNSDVFKDKVIYDRSNGAYRILDLLTPEEIINCKYNARSFYNYGFPKNYEARCSFDIFENRQFLVNPEINFKLAPHLKYTFGLEFETATGTIPEDICFRDGLIPLRDGSITGNEYSTVVLSGNYGLNLLKQQINTLKDYTYFDKNCSLHVHIGGFKLCPEVLWNIYKNCLYLQNELVCRLPQLTFRTSEYKDTHKDYCNLLSNMDSFEKMYKYMVGYPYLGSLNEPHPKDIERERKWNVNKRYFWVNFINALCYSGGKTIEFRFLRPTYNFNKIIFWLYIFNAIILASEQGIFVKSLQDLTKLYPSDIRNDLIENIAKVRLCSEIQSSMRDYIGERTDVENRIFDTDELI